MNRVDDGSQHNKLSLDRDKAIRLFTYLKDLCALRTPQVRNVETFDQVFWFRDLPRNKLCRCTVWRLTDPLTPTSEQPHDPWIEVRKPTLKSLPELPDELEPWIKDDEFANSSLEEPGFYEQMPRSLPFHIDVGRVRAIHVVENLRQIATRRFKKEVVVLCEVPNYVKHLSLFLPNPFIFRYWLKSLLHIIRSLLQGHWGIRGCLRGAQQIEPSFSNQP